MVIIHFMLSCCWHSCLLLPKIMVCTQKLCSFLFARIFQVCRLIRMLPHKKAVCVAACIRILLHTFADGKFPISLHCFARKTHHCYFLKYLQFLFPLMSTDLLKLCLRVNSPSASLRSKQGLMLFNEV